MTEQEKKPRGRPRKYAGKRPTWTIRLEEKYGEQIKAKATERGLSISEICEQEIVWAFRARHALDSLETKLEAAEAKIAELTGELREIQHASAYADLMKDTATETAARALEEVELWKNRMDAAVLRSIEIEKSRDRLVERVSELVEMLALSKGVSKKAAS